MGDYTIKTHYGEETKTWMERWEIPLVFDFPDIWFLHPLFRFNIIQYHYGGNNNYNSSAVESNNILTEKTFDNRVFHIKNT